MLEIQDPEHHAQVLEFAKKTSREAQLQDKLDWLANYACHGDSTKTRCKLYKDFAPYSYYFVMERRVAESRWTGCRDCGHNWIAPVERDKPTPNISGEATTYCPKCMSRNTHAEPVKAEYQHWFNGGLIFHGSHDGYGSGSAPSFSCTLTPTDGWSIHT